MVNKDSRIKEKLHRFTHPDNPVAKAFRIINIAAYIGTAILFIRSSNQAEKIERLENRNEDQNLKIDTLTETVIDARAKISGLTTQYELAQSELEAQRRASRDSPVPQWTKRVVGNNFIAHDINPAFEETWLKPKNILREQYIGNSDTLIFNKFVVKQIRKLDSIAFATGKPARKAIVIDGKTWYFTKYPIFYDGYPLFLKGWALDAPAEVVD